MPQESTDMNMGESGKCLTLLKGDLACYGAELDQSQIGHKPPHFDNPEGYFVTKDTERSSFWRTIYHFRLDVAPVLWVDRNGWIWKTPNAFYTDQGSVPWVASALVSKDRFIGFYFHDAAYRDHGLMCDKGDGRGFVFVELTRSEVDAMLYDQCLSDPDPAWQFTAGVVWSAVRSGGWMSW
jgi:hypothetical protein